MLFRRLKDGIPIYIVPSVVYCRWLDDRTIICLHLARFVHLCGQLKFYGARGQIDKALLSNGPGGRGPELQGAHCN